MLFTKREAGQMRIDIEEALQAVAKKYKADVKLGGIRYGSELGVRISFAKMAENENGAYVHSANAINFIAKAEGFGLSADVLGEKLMFRGDECIVLGYNKRAKRYPIEYTKNGRNFKCGVEHLKAMVKPSRPEFFL